MKHLNKKLLTISLFTAFAISLSITAKAIDIPNSTDPGAVDTAAKKIYEYNKVNNNKKEVIPEITDVKKKVQEAKIQKKTFLLRNITFNGNSVFTNEELNNFTKEYLDKRISIDEIVKIAINITNFYHDNGYWTSQAYIPPQKISKGHVEIGILEGKIGTISVEGNKWVRTNYLKKNILKANNFEENKIFNVGDLQNSLKTLNTGDYIKGKVVIEESEEQDLSNIILQIEDRFPLNVSTSWDNAGRRLVGTQRATIFLSDENLTGYGDRLYAGTSFAQRTFGTFAGYSVPLGYSGTRLNLDYSFSDVVLGHELHASDIEGQSHDYNISVTKPIYKSRNLIVNSDIAFDMRHSYTAMKAQPGRIGDVKYDLRVLRAGIDLFKTDAHGQWITRGEVSTGIPLLGATTESYRGKGSSKFVKLNADITRLQALPFKSLGIIKFNTQYSPNRLLAPEQFQIGGSTTVRGYEEGLVLGDYGFNNSFELRTPVPLLALALPEKYKHISNKFSASYFYDWGFTELMSKDYNENYENFLQSIGVGLNCNISKYMTAKLHLGIPLGKRRFDSHDARLHFSISSEVL